MRPIDAVVIWFLSRRRRVAVPLIVLFVVNQALFVYLDGWHEVWVSLIGWLGALAFIAIRYGTFIRLAFAMRPVKHR